MSNVEDKLAVVLSREIANAMIQSASLRGASVAIAIAAKTLPNGERAFHVNWIGDAGPALELVAYAGEVMNRLIREGGAKPNESPLLS
jgi:hypothetical protein